MRFNNSNIDNMNISFRADDMKNLTFHIVHVNYIHFIMLYMIFAAVYYAKPY